MLAIETSSRSGSVSILRGHEVLSTATGDPANSHSPKLLFLINEILERASIRLHDVDVFAVALGPGSFTGLRIGISTVIGFAEALGRPCVGVSTLSALAFRAGPSPKIAAWLRAGRGEVFAQLFSVEPSSSPRELSPAVHVSPAQFVDEILQLPGVKLSGDDHDVFTEDMLVLLENNGIGARPPTAAGHMVKPPLSESVGLLSIIELENGGAVGATDLRPIYVRPSDPELNRLCSRQTILTT
jgi:tRNA threonylcarbamoyladenosine biosynthesis protein TsaB